MGIKEGRAEIQNKYTPLLILWNSSNNSCLPASYTFLSIKMKINLLMKKPKKLNEKFKLSN